jgi:hypothetical protein
MPPPPPPIPPIHADFNKIYSRERKVRLSKSVDGTTPGGFLTSRGLNPSRLSKPAFYILSRAAFKAGRRAPSSY